MTLKECYESFGGDYDGVVGRMRSEALVKKFVIRFADDTSFSDLKKAVEDGRLDDAFRAAHTIKGVCQNLGFTKLQESSSLLTQHLRTGFGDDCSALLSRVTDDYNKTIEAITGLKDS